MPHTPSADNDTDLEAAMDGAPRWAMALAWELRAMRNDHVVMKKSLGELSDDGKGGTGVIGSVARLSADVAGLLSLKKQGMALLLGVIIAGSVAILGVKGAIAALLGKA